MSDPRDIIYGLASLVNDKSSHKVHIDYTLSTSEVYTEFARLEISSSRRLNILAHFLPGSDKGLPSWAPDWTGPEYNHLYLRYAIGKTRNFSAAADTDAIATFDASGSVLNFKGLPVGCLDAVGLPTCMRDFDNVNIIFLIAFSQWRAMIGELEGEE